MLVLIASYLLLVFVLPVALSGVVTYRAMPVGRRCPRCGEDTIELVARALRLVSRVSPWTRLQKRWCLGCGWEGATRTPRRRAERPSTTAPPPVRIARAPVIEPRAQTMDVCALDIDGRSWRVMLQCWSTTGTYYGRLVFVAPTGRLWLDAVAAFRGSNQHEVLGQALSLPEGLLAHRLRRLVSDH